MSTNGFPLRPVRLVHTSDLHLGDGLRFETRRGGLLGVIAAAHEARADAVIMAGDLFDSNRVSDEDVAFFLEAVASARVPVIALPGNHDSVETGSVYHRPAFGTPPPNLRLLADPKGEGVALEELDLYVWGRPTEFHVPDFRPLANVPALGPVRHGARSWYVTMAHGHFMDEPEQYTRSSPILPQDIAAARCDYVALGHWDRTTEVTQAGVTAWYSGAPEMEWRKTGHGQTLVVDLVPGVGAQVRTTPVFIPK